jgi:uncharacterized damage-inducible protein DinB
MNNTPKLIAKHFREVYFGGNWTVSCLKEHLADVTWQGATTPVSTGNTIAALTYHIHYFVRVVLRVLEGGPLKGDDKVSFDHPPINNSDDWKDFLNNVFDEGERFAILVEQLPEEKMTEFLGPEKYGDYYRNLQGIIEHTHYHLGQIALLKKLIAVLRYNA